MAFRWSNLFEPGVTGVRPQRWAKAASWGCLVCVLPSAGWRVAMLAGADTGFAEAEQFRSNTGLTGYVISLEVAQLTAATLCVGLASRWGERVPAWVPGLGGRRIHRLLPTVLGSLGALTTAGLLWPLLASFTGSWLGLTDAWTPDRAMDSGQRLVMWLCYGPLFLWPVLIMVAVAGYWRRREPDRRQPHSSAATGSIDLGQPHRLASSTAPGGAGTERSGR